MSADGPRRPARRPTGAARPKATGRTRNASKPKPKAKPKQKPKATVDPRMRARRIGVTRGRARRRLRVLIGATAMVILLVGALVVYVSPIFGITTIEVKGVNDTSAAEIKAALQDFKGTSVARVDDAELTEAVHVTLTGTVSDDRPVAYAPTTDGTAALVGPTGRVLSLADSAPQDLVRLEATLEPSVGGAVPLPVVPAVDVAAALTPDLVVVTEMVGADDDGIELTMAQGVRARLGSTDNLSHKLASIATLMSSEVESACLERIDVSDPTRATIRRDRNCTGAPA